MSCAISYMSPRLLAFEIFSCNITTTINKEIVKTEINLEGGHLWHVVVHVGNVPLRQEHHGEHQQPKTQSGHSNGLIPFQADTDVELKEISFYFSPKI